MKRPSVPALVLTAFFLAGIFALCVLTFATDGEGLFNSLRYRTKLSPYLPSDPGPLDMLEARIRSFDSEFSQNLYGTPAMQRFNASLQSAMGKKMLSLGSSDMIRLTTGQLYDIMEERDMTTAADEVASIASLVADRYGIPFTVLYEHPSVYRADMLPEGYDRLDHITDNADSYLGRLALAGVRALDSRELLPVTDEDLSRLLYSTDQHWTPLAQLKLARALAAECSLGAEKLDEALFEAEVHEKVFLGKYGQRLGPELAPPDDIVIWLPAYGTHITRTTLNNGSEETVSGSFSEAAVRRGELEFDDGCPYSTMAYRVLGLTEDMDLYTDPSAPDVTVLLLKDSYSAGIGAYLSLCCRTVVSVDMRKSDMSVGELIRRYGPDRVILAYSMRMLTEKQYVLED